MVKVLHLSSKEIVELNVGDWVREKKGVRTYEIDDIRDEVVIASNYDGTYEFDLNFVENNLVKLN